MSFVIFQIIVVEKAFSEKEIILKIILYSILSLYLLYTAWFHCSKISVGSSAVGRTSPGPSFPRNLICNQFLDRFY